MKYFFYTLVILTLAGCRPDAGQAPITPPEINEARPPLDTEDNTELVRKRREDSLRKKRHQHPKRHPKKDETPKSTP